MMGEVVYESDSVPYLKKRVELYANRTLKLTTEITALRGVVEELCAALEATKDAIYYMGCGLEIEYPSDRRRRERATKEINAALAKAKEVLGGVPIEEESK